MDSAALDKLLAVSAQADRCSHQAIGIYLLAKEAPHLIFWQKDVKRLLEELKGATEEAEGLLRMSNSAHP